MRIRAAMLLAVAAVGLIACRTTRPAHPIESVVVRPFQGENPVTNEAVRNVIIGWLARESTVRVLRDGDADVVVEGTVTSGRGAGAKSGWGANASAGEFVSGVTALASRNGEIFTAAEWGQPMSGDGLRAPEQVAMEVAVRLVKALRKNGLP